MDFDEVIQGILDRVTASTQHVPPETHLHLLKARQQCEPIEALLKNHPRPLDKSASSVLLNSLSKIILDYTFCLETELTNSDFSSKDTEKELQEIIDLLSVPERLCAQLSTTEEKQHHNVLDDDILECLHWRRGALFYMYCCTKYQDDGTSITDKQQFSKFLTDGVRFLQRMLSTRTPQQFDACANAGDAAKLISEGIYSDTHLLALMYAGEMCYWFLRLNGDVADNIQFNARQVGSDLLKKYLDIVEGPLKDQQWNTSRAKEILQFLS